MNFVIVFLGGGIGSALRHGCNLLAMRLVGTAYPWGTFCINVLGSFAMGAIVEAFALRAGLSPTLRLFLATGILGGFTTFSTFSLDAAALYQRGQVAVALLYVAGSVLVGVGALMCGAWAVSAMAVASTRG